MGKPRGKPSSKLTRELERAERALRESKASGEGSQGTGARSYLEIARTKGIGVHSLGQVLADLGKSRGEAVNIFYEHYLQQGISEELARKQAESSIREQYDSHKAKK